MIGYPPSIGDLYRQVFAVQAQALECPWELALPSPEKAAGRLGGGRILLQEGMAGEVNLGLAQQTLSWLIGALDLIEQGSQGVAEEETTFFTADWREKAGEILLKLGQRHGFLIRALPAEKWKNVPRFAAWFATVASLVPLYRCFSQAVEEAYPMLLESWQEGYCPVCGLRPSMGYLEAASGRRVLECWFCATRWPFPRLRCPFCGCSKPEKLGIFFFQDDPGLRLYYCQECNLYQKVMDAASRPAGNLGLAWKNLGSWELDMAAKERGYHPGAGYPVLPGFPR